MITFERIEHPCSDGSHQWSVVALKDRFQIGGYIGPAADHPELCRAYVHFGKCRTVRHWHAEGAEFDINSTICDLPESECRDFIERHAPYCETGYRN